MLSAVLKAELKLKKIKVKVKLLKKLRKKFFYVYSEERMRYHLYIGDKRYYTINKQHAERAVRSQLLKYAREHYK